MVKIELLFASCHAHQIPPVKNSMCLFSHFILILRDQKFSLLHYVRYWLFPFEQERTNRNSAAGRLSTVSRKAPRSDARRAVDIKQKLCCYNSTIIWAGETKRRPLPPVVRRWGEKGQQQVLVYFCICHRRRLYDTIGLRDAILTCARKPTWVGLIYRAETTTIVKQKK